ncbi:hypothetical protein A5844_000158 [Enterococcus sp. 10A9_DIV0425]|uniref:UPF0398 protein A5844_000158 n=1 Tax=Candidatus Enterococcus wittei TaxID=1987383 RepID=A0A2C9XP22_9ENTE|nr:DUF1273 domain-containing protein [Enterococcus sp. 10A9_DIV0425]OTP11943.1 hypothetical protein A5844_000158 [Enterococcus sp. 10A9_DIV0425]THE16004.1 DUF1273 domain-containing protein [Enterococcus hirae]
MDIVKVMYVSGYRSFELGIFKENDPKITVVKKVLKNELSQFCEEGLEWVIISGNLGVEQWAGEVTAELKGDYPELQLGIIYPFADFGSGWNEGNKEKKSLIEQLADYVESVSHQPYQSPAQLKNHTNFILQHTNGSLLIYDPEFPGKADYFLRDAQKFQQTHPYEIRSISMDDLQNFSE